MMLLAFISSLFHLLSCAVIEIGIYSFVEVFAKAALEDERDDAEKKKIWAAESAVLVVFCLLVYYYHHMPYLLLIMASITLLYSQLLGRVDFRYWYRQMATRWDEFQQHEESMGHLRNRRESTTPAPSFPVVTTPVTVPNPAVWVPRPTSHMQTSFDTSPADYGSYCEVWHPPDSDRPQPAAAMATSYSESSNKQQIVRQRRCSPTVSLGPNYIPVSSDLTRRPLHPTSPGFRQQPVDNPSLTSRLKSSFRSALGIQCSTLPPGLQNSGQNLCFMNSVLQCMAHTPCLVESLSHDALTSRGSKSKLITAMSDLLRKLCLYPGSLGDVHSLDTTDVRAVISSVPLSVVIDTRQGQQLQQDSAEFLMWLLGELHNALNDPTNKPPVVTVSGSALPIMERHPYSPRLTVMTLNMLKFIYGDLSSERIEKLKLTCRKEIDQAHGLDNDSYAEAIQRLADLEWMTYKEENNTAVSDLFTGQLVEAQHCLGCNRILVELQTFSVLPVPIVQSRRRNGLVHLQDCFIKYGNIEELFGPNGLQCANCARNALRYSPGMAAQKTSTPTPGGVIDPRMTMQGPTASPISLNRVTANCRTVMDQQKLQNTPVSPIPNTDQVLNDSGFHDNQYKTSTPIRDGVAPPRLKVAYGQRRALLRQLPECLIVQLMRFSVSQGQAYKVHRPVSIPLVNLDLTHLVIDNVLKREDPTTLNGCFRYDLYGLCVHLGGESTSYGHYISYSKAADGHWYKFDDEVVTAVNMEYELNTRPVRENAYLVFLKKSVMT